MNGTERPIGRDARPGDLQGPYNPPWRACRRCGGDCGREGHPYGCPRTPGYTAVAGMPLRPCYCGQTMVLAPSWLGTCCEDTPPVRVPGGCALCGDDRCRVCDPDDEPEEWRGPPEGDWVHPRCRDEFLGPHDARPRQERRRIPLGVVAP